MAATQNGYKHDDHQDAKALVNGYHEKNQNTSPSPSDPSPLTKDSSESQSLLSTLLSALDRFLPPSSRDRLYNSTSNYIRTRPRLSSFIAFQLIFCTLPIIIFAGFTLSVLIAFLTFALVGALFAAGVALLFLVPTLLLTASTAVLAWAWFLGVFYAGQWVYLRVCEVGGWNSAGWESGKAEVKKED